MKKTKNILLKTFLLIVFISFLLVNVFGQSKFNSEWDNTYKFSSDDGQFKLKFGGRLMTDWAIFSQDDSMESNFGELKPGAEFRKIWFYNSGQIYNNIKYKVQLSFDGGEVVLKDVFIEMTDIPLLGNIRFGHFKEPFRFDVITSSKNVLFMENSLHTGFANTRSTGVMIHNNFLDKKISFQTGVFFNSDKQGNPLNSYDYNFTSRLTALAFVNENKTKYLHLGSSYSLRIIDDVYNIKSKPESHLCNTYLNTNDIDFISNLNLIGTEAYLVLGSFSFQSEYTISSVDRGTKDDYSFSALYGQVGFYLTGEHKSYKSALSPVGRTYPKNNVGNGKNGIGAWELALRYSSIDLNSKDIKGGKLHDIAMGVNWYLNPATKIIANYI
ncbi:MAG: porin, partial [Bacteroidota bacterium]|nr:porin [Bacteroidota bacterium]